MKLLDKQKLKGKVAIVTGGGKEIGRAIALGFAKEGVNLVVCGRIESYLEEVCQEVRSMGISALLIKANVSIESEVENMVGEALKTFGKIDILVNNAGVPGPTSLITKIISQTYSG